MHISLMDILCCPACGGDLSLTPEEQLRAEVLRGTLNCSECAAVFHLSNGIPNLIHPPSLAAQMEKLERMDREYASRYDYANKMWLLKRGLVSILWESLIRRSITDRLNLKADSRLLETGVGTASNLKVIAKTAPGPVRLHGTDISGAMLELAARKLARLGKSARMTQANASYLPYKAECFDAVLHVGAINQMSEQERAIAEMCRVAKIGARIVICDEGVHPAKARTPHGKWLLRQETFRARPPLEILPRGIKGLETSWILQKAFWIVEFVKN